MGGVAGSTLPGTAAARLPGQIPALKPHRLDPRLPGGSPVSTVTRPTPASVYIETSPGSNYFRATERFDLRSIKLAQDGGDMTMSLSCGLDSDQLTTGGAIGAEHFAHLVADLSPDKRIRVAQRFGVSPANVLFQGYPMTSTIQWSPRNQMVSCMCVSEAHEILRHDRYAQIYERRMRRYPMREWDPVRPDDVAVELPLPIFNAGGKPNRSPENYPFDFGGLGFHFTPLFVEDDAPEAAYWSYADAISYVALMYVLRHGLAVDVSALLHDLAVLVGVAPSPESRDPLARALTARVPDIGIASMNVEEAIGELVRSAGLHYALETRNVSTGRTIQVQHSVQIYAPRTTAADAAYVPYGRRMRLPRAYDIPRRPPFADHTLMSDFTFAQASGAQQTVLTQDRRAINAAIIMGGPREYEGTFLMRPGWLPNEICDFTDEDYDPEHPEGLEALREAAFNALHRDFVEDPIDPATTWPMSIYHGKHPNHLPVSDVLRYWVFPDDWRLMPSPSAEESPYARYGWGSELYSPYDPDSPDRNVLVRSDIGGGISDAATWVPRRRPPGDLIARRNEAGDQAPVLRFLFDHTDPLTALARPVADWHRYGGNPRIDPDRMGVQIRVDDLFDPSLLEPDEDGVVYADGPGLVRAYIFGKLQVALTCTIRGDQRLRTWPGVGTSSFSRERCRVHDTGLDTFQLRDRRGGNSYLNEEPEDPDPQFEGRFDLDALGDRGVRLAELAAGDTVSGPIEIPWIETSYACGDTFTGCSGLGIALNRYPAIVRIEYSWDKHAGYRTTLHLSDQRHSPDVDDEE